MVTVMASANDYLICNLPIDQQIVYDAQYLHHQAQQAKNVCKAMERMTMTVAKL